MRTLVSCTWHALILAPEQNGYQREFYPQDCCTKTDLYSVDFLNASARSLTDRIAVLDTRGAGHIRDRIQWLTIENFSGINGDATLNLHGFDVRANKHSDELHMLIINHRPPIDPLTGDALDASKLGANSTIEQFTTKVGSSSMRHGKTTSNPLIHSPNRVAWVSDHSFVVSNDHSTNVPSLVSQTSSQSSRPL